MKKLLLFLVIVMLLSACQTATQDTDADIAPTEPTLALSYEDNIYFVLVDRFNDSNPNLPDVDKDNPKAYQGGDIKGVIEKLDYLKSMGMTAIWLSPVMDNAPKGYHGYWIHDFYAVDEHFGTIDDVKLLVNEAHKRDMKVILDYVVNHTGEGIDWLDDPDKTDWFHENMTITNWSDKEQLVNGWIYGLPDLNQENTEVRDYLVDNAKWWISKTGIDGFRLDTVRHVSDEFWTHFIKEIKSDYPDFYLMGEVWNHNARILKIYQNLGMDGITNYSLYTGFEQEFSSHGDMNAFAKLLRDESVFADASLNSFFIDNHDNPRFYKSTEEFSEEYTRQALTFLYTYPAISTLYYGTESLLEGEYDPANRLFMPWAETGKLVPFITGLTKLKARYLESFEMVSYDEKHLAYKIGKGDDNLLIVMSIDTESSDFDVAFSGKLKNYYTDEKIENSETLSIEMEPVSTLIFIIE